MIRTVAVAAAALAGSLALPVGARAGQIVFHVDSPTSSDTFGVMEEDGSGQRTWLDVYDATPPSGGQRFVTGYGPRIARDGRRVVFTTETLANKEPGRQALGANAQGVNVWEAGVVRRLSGPPMAVSGVSTFESDGVPATDGRIVFAITGATSNGNSITSTSGALHLFNADLSDGGGFDTDCQSIGLGIDGFDPDPADPGLLAYGGCSDADGKDAIRVGRNGAADQVIRTAPASTDGYASSISDPAWRPDGGRIASIESAGQGPTQLWSYAPDGSGAVRLLTAPSGMQLSAPVWVGQDKLAFTLQTGTGSGSTSDVWALPAACVDCPLTSATRLTTSGLASAPSWSPAGLVGEPKAPTGPTGSTGPTGTTGTTGGPGMAQKALRSVRVVKAKRGIALRVDLARASRVVVSVTGPKPRRKVRRVTLTLRAGVNVVRLRKVAGRRLVRGSYRVAVAVSGSPRVTVKARVRG